MDNMAYALLQFYISFPILEWLHLNWGPHRHQFLAQVKIHGAQGRTM